MTGRPESTWRDYQGSRSGKQAAKLLIRHESPEGTKDVGLANRRVIDRAEQALVLGIVQLVHHRMVGERGVICFDVQLEAIRQAVSTQKVNACRSIAVVLMLGRRVAVDQAAARQHRAAVTPVDLVPARRVPAAGRPADTDLALVVPAAPAKAKEARILATHRT